MGQKIHPIGFRLSVNRNWQSCWFATPREFPKMLQQDIEIRNYVSKSLGHASIGKVVIERPSKSARIIIYSSKPGVVIGKKGEGIEKLRQDMQKKLGVAVAINIEELRKPELNAQIVGDSIAQQLEKRIMFRRAMKRAMQQAIRVGAQGIKIECSGRLNGIEIARSEWYREGRVPMHTLRSNIDYALSEAKTTYGIIGIKVWLYRGDSLVHEVTTETKTHITSEEQSKDANLPRTIRISKKKTDTEESTELEPEEKPAKKAKTTKAKISKKTEELKTPKKKATKKPTEKKTSSEKEPSSKKVEKTEKSDSNKKTAQTAKAKTTKSKKSSKSSATKKPKASNVKSKDDKDDNEQT